MCSHLYPVHKVRGRTGTLHLSSTDTADFLQYSLKICYRHDLLVNRILCCSTWGTVIFLKRALLIILKNCIIQCYYIYTYMYMYLYKFTLAGRDAEIVSNLRYISFDKHNNNNKIFANTQLWLQNILKLSLCLYTVYNLHTTFYNLVRFSYPVCSP